MPTASFLCISHAALDRAAAEYFCQSLAGFGFASACIDESTPDAARDRALTACTMLLVLTSPASSLITSCEADFHYMMGLHRPVMCIRLAPSALEDRLTEGDGALAERFLSLPPVNPPNDRTVADFIHRLLIRHLCRLPACFDADGCVDPRYGRLIRSAVRAWQGDVPMQFVLGLAYDNGEVLPHIDTEAAMWISKAAAARYIDAMLYLGDMTLRGDGVDKNPADALRLFGEVSSLGDPRGHYACGLCYLYGYGVMKDPEMALHYMTKAAKEGYTPASYRLGLMYRDGIGMPYRQWRRAVLHLYAACRAEGLDAPLYGRCLTGHIHYQRYHCVSMRHMRQLRLGDLLFSRRHPLWREDAHLVTKVKRSFARCRAQAAGYPEDHLMTRLPPRDTARYDPLCGYSRQPWDVSVAAEALGRLLERGDPKRRVHPAPRAALAWYRRAMQRGNSDAMYRLGEAYRSGRGVPAGPAQAVKLFRQCADLHNEQGRFALGVCYERGIGVPRDPSTAVTQYEKAARAGYAPAQNNLGGCYEHGIGVTRDMLAAIEWYSKAAATGQPHAICRLGACYEDGRGVTRNTERAFHLYERAAEQGHAYAMYRLALCYDKGIYVEEHPAMAAHLYERAAKGGVAEASYAFGLCCQNGRGVRRDERAGFLCFTEASARGHIRGAYETARCYLEGRAAVQSFERAIEAYEHTVTLYDQQSRTAIVRQDDPARMADRQAAADALYRVGYCLLYGVGRRVDAPAKEAAARFGRAAALGHREAMTALGDLYTYRRITDGDPPKEALQAYENAARLGQHDALISLSEAYRKQAVALAAAGDTEGATAAYAHAREYLITCAAAGDADAILALAVYTHFGWGCAANEAKALELLGRTESADRHSSDDRTAYLWLGDMYYIGRNHDVDLAAADAAYRYAAAFDPDAPCPMHLLRERWAERMTYAAGIRAEAYYRMAILRAVGFEDDRRDDREDAFAYLAAAILTGHTGALDDLARMYTYEKACADEAEAALLAAGRKRHRAPADAAPTTDRYNHLAWMTAYYSARRPTLQPFTLQPVPLPREGAPAYVTAEVTPTMRACALNHLGDCLFEGTHIHADPAAAVRCYRRAAETRQARGEPPAGGIIWAKYSLGWCLLNGKGTPKNPREAVRFLAEASRYHADAAYCMGTCHMTGVGVDGHSIREAIKYFRKAQDLHHPEAAARLKALERQLR